MKRLIILMAILTLPIFVWAAKPGFTVWQLPSQANSVGNSYVFLTDKGRVMVLDGGEPVEELFLRGFLAALGNNVDTWIISHPHIDHMGALTAILKEPKGIKIGTLYHSPLTQEQLKTDGARKVFADAYYKTLSKSTVNTVVLDKPGLSLKIDGMNLLVLGVSHPDILVNAYNNGSIVLRVWDSKKSLVFLGDTGVESGCRLLESPYRPFLDCDYLQLAHHGQQGVDKDFYQSIKFRACLWATPTWVWNNDVGDGYNTAYMKTIETRLWMDELGIKEHYIAWQGIVEIE